MAFDSKKTILLEKTYLYVRASLGFQLEGTSTEKIPTNNGFYRFFVDNLQKSIGNSYVNILYDSRDLTLQCFCSDLYMDELMSSDSSAIEDVVEELKKNTTTIIEFENGVSSALQSNHEDNVLISTLLDSLKNGFIPHLNSSMGDFFSFENFYGSVVSFLSPLGFCENFHINPDDFVLSNYHGVSDVDFYEFTREFGHLSTLYFNKLFPSSIKKYGSFNMLTYYINNEGKYIGSFKGNTIINCYTYDYFGVPSNSLRNIVRVTFTPEVFNYVVGFSTVTKKYLGYSFSNNKLVLLSKHGVSCCFNQSLDCPFTGGFLDIVFESNLDVALLNGLTLRLRTDVGSRDFSLSELGLFKPEGQNFIILMTNFPKFEPLNNLTPSRLVGIEVF